jgi:hypothetical protein
MIDENDFFGDGVNIAARLKASLILAGSSFRLVSTRIRPALHVSQQGGRKSS